MQSESAQEQSGLVARLLNLALPVAALIIALVAMYLGFDFLRAGSAPKWLIVLVAIVWGVGGVAALYWILNWIVERMNLKWRGRLQPFVFVGPAIVMLMWFLAVPVLRTFWLSLFNRDGPPIGWLNSPDERSVPQQHHVDRLWCDADRHCRLADRRPRGSKQL